MKLLIHIETRHVRSLSVLTCVHAILTEPEQSHVNNSKVFQTTWICPSPNNAARFRMYWCSSKSSCRKFRRATTAGFLSMCLITVPPLYYLILAKGEQSHVNPHGFAHCQANAGSAVLFTVPHLKQSRAGRSESFLPSNMRVKLDTS